MGWQQVRVILFFWMVWARYCLYAWVKAHSHVSHTLLSNALVTGHKLVCTVCAAKSHCLNRQKQPISSNFSALHVTSVHFINHVTALYCLVHYLPVSHPRCLAHLYLCIQYSLHQDGTLHLQWVIIRFHSRKLIKNSFEGFLNDIGEHIKTASVRHSYGDIINITTILFLPFWAFLCLSACHTSN